MDALRRDPSRRASLVALSSPFSVLAWCAARFSLVRIVPLPSPLSRCHCSWSVFVSVRDCSSPLMATSSTSALSVLRCACRVAGVSVCGKTEHHTRHPDTLAVALLHSHQNWRSRSCCDCLLPLPLPAHCSVLSRCSFRQDATRTAQWHPWHRPTLSCSPLCLDSSMPRPLLYRCCCDLSGCVCSAVTTAVTTPLKRRYSSLTQYQQWQANALTDVTAARREHTCTPRSLRSDLAAGWGSSELSGCEARHGTSDDIVHFRSRSERTLITIRLLLHCSSHPLPLTLRPFACCFLLPPLLTLSQHSPQPAVP